jgi:hypothetical protein
MILTMLGLEVEVPDLGPGVEDLTKLGLEVAVADWDLTKLGLGSDWARSGKRYVNQDKNRKNVG